MIFYSFHLRISQFKWLQTLESGNVPLGVKEFRQPCRKHDKITCALFSLTPEAGKVKREPNRCNHFRQLPENGALAAHLNPIISKMLLVEGHVVRGGTKNPRNSELIKTENVFSKGVESLLRDSETNSVS